jgi:hypothetical protein
VWSPTLSTGPRTAATAGRYRWCCGGCVALACLLSHLRGALPSAERMKSGGEAAGLLSCAMKHSNHGTAYANSNIPCLPS